MKDDNKHLCRKMAQAIDDVMEIMRDGVLFDGITEDAWEKVNQIQNKANEVKNEILELEKIIE